MAVRKRFKPAERAAFTKGTEIEWLNSSTWRPGRILTGEVKTHSYGGSQYVELVDTGKTTRTMSPGQLIWGTPGGVRLPETEN